MEPSEILFDVRDRVATLTLNRPERMNALSPSLEATLRECVAAAVADDQVRAIVLTGAGRGFCVGAQMNKLAENADGGATTAASPRSGNIGQRYSYLLDVPKPIIAAINGPVAGVGVCIALYCDLRYMVAGSKLSTSFARRGLVAEHGSAWMLSRLVGPMNASDLLLSARSVVAEEAERIGLVRVLPPDHFGTAVHAIASGLANLSSPRSMRSSSGNSHCDTFRTLKRPPSLPMPRSRNAAAPTTTRKASPVSSKNGRHSLPGSRMAAWHRDHAFGLTSAERCRASFRRRFDAFLEVLRLAQPGLLFQLVVGRRRYPFGQAGPHCGPRGDKGERRTFGNLAGESQCRRSHILLRH
jgi:enoyl-CoA hydratase/carnithine racemase